MDTSSRFALHHKALLVAAALGVLLGLSASPAHAIPSFARKYGTSCQTCHTIYPKLTPFGEAFRRNGYLFPGKDTDFVKQETVSLGQEAYKSVFPNAVWPGTLAESLPVGVGFIGQAVLHPDTNAGAAQNDNNSAFTMNDLVAEAHLWSGGSFSDNITFFGEVTLTKGGVNIEHAAVHFNNIVGPKHLVNLRVGRGFSTLTSFGMHSTYVADTLLPGVFGTALYGNGGDSWSAKNEFNGLELTGTAGGRFIYSLGVNAGTNIDIRPTENFYGHLGLKLGGMRLDGEEGGAQPNPGKPWAENAVTLDAFGYRSTSHFTPYALNDPTGNPTTPAAQDDEVWLLGGALRAQLESFELNSGIYQEWHDHAVLDSGTGKWTGLKALSQWNEASYIVYPWLVPAVRVELTSLLPSTTGSKRVNDVRVMPGISFLVRPTVRFSLVGQIEWADGVPMLATLDPSTKMAVLGNWAAAGGSAAPAAGKKVTEIESITASMWLAF